MMTQTPPIQSAPDSPQRRPRMFLVLLPLLGFALLSGLFLKQLLWGGDTSRIPSVLIGKHVPAFTLPPLEGMNVGALTDKDLTGGQVTLVNIFASWCIPCREEHGFLMSLSADPAVKAAGVRIAGIAYKDEPANARAFLARGNPYAMIGTDKAGRAAIDWGVYGVPETFVVRGDGTIAYKLVGPMNDEIIRTTLLPEIEKARTSQAPRP